MAKQKPQKKKLVYPPARLAGLMLLIPLCLLLPVLNIVGFVIFSRREPGFLFFLTFILSVLALFPVGLILYRTYALLTGGYRFDHSALIIHWGLRQERIPLTEIEWIRFPDEMGMDIPWPFFPMPGAYVGAVELPTSTTIEFMASDVSRMLFVGTSQRIYGVSPANPSAFLEGFERALQLGSVEAGDWKTVRPADWLAVSWKNRIARFSFMLSLGLIILLSLWVGFRFSGIDTVSLGYQLDGTPNEAIPARNVLIIPIMSAVFGLSNLLIGVWLYQKQSLQKIAELVWETGILISFFFLLAGFFIL